MKQFMSGTGRVWRAIVALALLATTVAVTPATAGAQAEPHDDTQAVQFTIENLQPDDGFFFTEAWVGLHNGDFDLFNDGERATPGLEALAEGGNTALLGEEFAAPGRLQTTVGNGNVQFISPGEVIEGSIDVRNAQAYRFASFASMIIPSNDAFIGNGDGEAYEVFDADGNPTGDIVIDILASDIYDSGTEVNDGQGAAGFSLGPVGGTGGGTSTDDTTSTVGIHPDLLANIENFQTAAGTVVTDLLDPDEPVARITIRVGESIKTESAVGPLFDGYVKEVVVCGADEVTVNIGLGDVPTEGDDVILGTDGDDVINGLGGNDVICGEGGNDIINAGRGADTVFGGAGADVINAGQGRDTVYGQGGDDFVSGGRGKDTIVGGGGDDDLRGNNGTDTISGGAGNDAINGGQKADALNGDNGDDTIVGGTRPDTIDGGNGVDTIDGGGSDFDTCVEDAGDSAVVSCEILS